MAAPVVEGAVKRERSNGMMPHIRVGGGLIVGLLAFGTAGRPGWAVTFETMTGAPVQMQPYVSEPGAPIVTVTPGTSQPFSGLGSGSSGGGSSGTGGGGEALNTMLGTTWGAQAVTNAQALGVNPSVVAATCMVESGCQNVSGPGTVSGAFQMTNSTYTQDMQRVVAQNPDLAGSVDTSLAGKMNPANQAFGAAQDLKDAAIKLQNAGISNPTFTDTRAIFQWGVGPGPDVAQANSSANMSQILSNYYTPAQMSGNGITSTTTVGEWRAAFAKKVGSAATQQVLIGG